MKRSILRVATTGIISILAATLPCHADTLADGMKKLVGFQIGGAANIINTERDERTGLMRVQLSNGMIFGVRAGDDQLIDSSSGDTIICFRQIPFGVEHRLVIEDAVYIAQRLQ